MRRLVCAILLAEVIVNAGLGSAATVPGRATNVPPRAIVVDGQPAASIVLQPNPSDREKQAAKEIQHYVAKSSGATLPIVEGPVGARDTKSALKCANPATAKRTSRSP